MTDDQHVYAICHPEGFVKIGVSKDPTQRLNELQTASPYDLWLGAQIQTDVPRELEQYLHERFDDKHVNGEWFELSPAEWDFIADLLRIKPESVDDLQTQRERRRETILRLQGLIG